METNKQPNHIDFFAPKVLWTIIGVLLLVVVAGSVAWYREIKKTPKVADQQQNATADWKTFSDSKYGFEFKYPSSAKVTPVQASGPGQFSVEINYEGRQGLEPARLIIGTSGDSRSFIVPIKANKFSGDNSDGKTYEGENPIEFTLGNNYVYANCVNYAKEPAVIDFCNGIISTFKFTTANSITYTNSKYGFELQLTDAWKGYKVFSSQGSTGVGSPTYLAFAMPSSDKSKCVANVTDEVCGYVAPFTITVIAKDRQDNISGSTKIAEDTANAFYYNLYAHYNELPADLSKINFEIPKVISTFMLTNSTAVNWRTYTNKTYGFQIQFTEAWKNYKVEIEPMSSNFGAGTLLFRIPTTDKNYGDGSGYATPLAISIYNSSYWNKRQAEGGPIGKYLGKSSAGWVFVANYWQDPPKDLMNVNFELDKVLSTFKLITTLAPNVIKDGSKLRVGDKVGAMIVSKVGRVLDNFPLSADNVYLEFTGKVEVTGTYEGNAITGELGSGDVCFNNFDSDSLKKLPIVSNISGFCISNEDFAHQQLGSGPTKGTATIVIEDRRIGICGCEALNDAKLIEVKSKK
jgi:hypothetical protein